MGKSNLSGKYLITRNKFAFKNEPEIFLLLEEEDNQITGVCVNEFVILNSEQNKTSEVALASMFADHFEEAGSKFYIPLLHSPVLKGGSDETSSFYFIHTGYDGATESQVYLENFYYKNNVKQFVESIVENSFPTFAQLVYGSQKFTREEININRTSGDWELRWGLDWMTYCPQLERKFKYVGMLHKEEATDHKIGKLDIGNLMQQIMGLFQEAGPSMMSTATFAYYRNETDLNDEEILEAVRMTIAISETEGNNVTEIMEKYTHTEIISQYNDMLNGKYEFKLLDQFDKRRAMIEDLGLNPIAYDAHVARSAFGLINKPEKKPQEEKNDSSSNLERTLAGLMNIVKGK
ncbi:MAG: hypothetical protein OCD03_09415 [Hyphomicrobiales bacterium]